MGRLDGQTAWITGAASGMGEAIAEVFVEEGANVALVDNRAHAGKKVADRISGNGGSAIFTECDVGQSRQVLRSIERTAERFHGLHIIVNCAGIVHIGPLHETHEADWDRLMAVNLKSIYHSVTHGIRHLSEHPRSYMVNIGSVGSHVAQSSTPVYTTSKFAVLGLSMSIAVDYAHLGLRCNCICPGITDTPMLRKHLNATPDPEAALAERLNRVPLNVALTPRDIARTVVYLSCEDSAGVTGTSIVVDAGYTSCAEWDCSRMES